MLIKLGPAVAGALMVLAPNADVSKNAMGRGVDVYVPKNAVIARNGKRIELEPEHRQFLRGVYVLNPGTVADLLYDDTVVMMQFANEDAGAVSYKFRVPRALLPRSWFSPTMWE